MIANTLGEPTLVSVSGDLATTAAGVMTVGANAVALATDTTGNYIGTATATMPIVITGSGVENGVLDASCPTCVVTYTEISVAGATTLTTASTLVLASVPSVSYTITLPNPALFLGKSIVVTKTNSSISNITVSPLANNAIHRLQSLRSFGVFIATSSGWRLIGK
jgi:hypothetical protein